MVEDPRIAAILTFIQALAAGESPPEIALSDEQDEVDAIAAGLNMLAEELRHTTISRDEYQRLNTELQDALDHVKTLHGLLPICAWCKKIRNDDGGWSKIENYLHEQTDAQFTHSICPECTKTL